MRQRLPEYLKRNIIDNEKTKTLVGGIVEAEITGGNLCLISDL